MFDRFTTVARAALVRSEAEARAAGADAILPVHLALGCLSQPAGDAVRLVEDLGGSAQTIADRIRPAEATTSDRQVLPMSDAVKQILTASMRLAMDVEHTMVTSAHLLAEILVADPSGVVVSSDASLSAERLRGLVGDLHSTETVVVRVGTSVDGGLREQHAERSGGDGDA